MKKAAWAVSRRQFVSRRGASDEAELEIQYMVHDTLEKENPSEGDQLSIATQPGRTDLANCRRFAGRYSGVARHCRPWKSWMVWDGQRWRSDDTGGVIRLAKNIADALWDEASKLDSQEARRFAADSASDKRIRAMLRLAESESGIPVLPCDFDKDQWLLNCPNGTVDLRTGELRAHDRDDLHTKLCPTRFDPDATAPTWERFLWSVFAGDEELVGFLRRYLGHCLTGCVNEQVLVIMHGDGSNGKSTLLNAFLDVLGPDYGMQGQPDMLTQKRQEGHATERMDLFGRRFVVTAETEGGQRLKESYVKQLTGGERIRGRRMRQDSWEFTPTHKVVLCTNHKPPIQGTDHAIWRRLALLPFGVVFWNPDKGESGPPELRQEKDLPERLRAEREGILAWCVQGCLEWQRSGLAFPKAVQDATAVYRADSDALGGFIAECCTTGKDHKMVFSTFYAQFARWCGEVGHRCPTKKAVGSDLAKRGYEVLESGDRRYGGLGLRDNVAT